MINRDPRANVLGIRFVNVDIDEVFSRDEICNLDLERAELAEVLTHEHAIPIDGRIVPGLSYLQEIAATRLDPCRRDIEVLLVPD